MSAWCVAGRLLSSIKVCSKPWSGTRSSMTNRTVCIAVLWWLYSVNPGTEAGNADAGEDEERSHWHSQQTTHLVDGQPAIRGSGKS